MIYSGMGTAKPQNLGGNALFNREGVAFMKSKDLVLRASSKPTKFRWVQNLLKHGLTFLYFTDKGNDPKNDCPTESVE